VNGIIEISLNTSHGISFLEVKKYGVWYFTQVVPDEGDYIISSLGGGGMGSHSIISGTPAEVLQ
jgi:hypothetical protein